MKTNRLILLLFGMLSLSLTVSAQRGNGTWDVFDSGAKGDGKTKDTKAIQAAIDKCHAAGGGRVYLHNGTFLSGTIYLKSNVTLHIEAGATLLGSDNVNDFPSISSKYPSYTGDFVTNKMLIYAEDAVNIAITGYGTIDGRGDDIKEPYLSPSFSGRPRIIHFRACENVKILRVKLYNSASWVQSYQSCKNVLIDGITVDSRENKDIEKPRWADAKGRNNDGLDLVDCQQVRIANCNISSGDDAICLKSFSPDEACRDITITNCIVSSNASGIKIGTETSGTMEDITVSNCVVYDTRVDAISMMTADGATVQRITFSGITMRNIKGGAIFVRLNKRNRPYRKNAKINEPVLKDILIENIQGTRISADYSSSISGIPDAFVENITLRNINLTFEGGMKAADADRQIPEQEKGYPNGLTFGRLPAYGFFIRHAKNVFMDNIQLRFLKEDQRPAIVCEDVEGLEITKLKAQRTAQTPVLVRKVNVREKNDDNDSGIK
ncbi:glycoside hydrolase family 28 protein [Dyadobacter aurulentus]|uniref:glycoside hydrolase family 28 protein n=1 Tax=Dyadobacter sp. UC 10 TaxID=2605428 RepID=UPI001788DB97|nr:glycoside hydrolase family 28 protein [Dyadobacter sp. UC 10]